MFILIPIGGIGTRFKNNGYSQPKALINVLGKPIVFWLLDNLKLSNNIDFIFIPYNKEYSKYNFEDILTNKYPHLNFKFLVLKHNTRGAAETINISLKYLIDNHISDQPMLCLDSDNFYTTNIVLFWNGDNKIFSFNDTNKKPIYSYISTNSNDVITDIKEKHKISDNACTGAYGFNSYIDFYNASKFVIDNNIKDKNEFYTSTVIKYMISSNFIFFYKNISSDHYYCLGTPTQVRLFCNNFSPTNDFIPKRFCFDLDNTLVSFPKKHNDYSSVKPIIKNINSLKYLKSLGHTIIIYTARRMRTHNGNTGKILADVGPITFNTLHKFDIPYDELCFGKPYADFYIDDKAFNANSDIEKELGFYNAKIETRSFNSIVSSSIDTFTKYSNNLSSEIFYYNHIPQSIKHFFPLFIRCDPSNNKWYQVEKIKGITANEMFLSQILNTNHLKAILHSIHTIHFTPIKDISSNVDIYANYSKKLSRRYNKFDYSKFPNHNDVFNNILTQLKLYENNNYGFKTIIHGDPVFTNILIDCNNSIKFIDMRGRLDVIDTILGDSFYDYAKILQSLIGYDEILQQKNVSEDYRDPLILFFKSYFINIYDEPSFKFIQIVTKSLLFSLIPLHNNDKCYDYFNLINSKYLNDF
jgi:capsule biosynthesis phosphatase